MKATHFISDNDGIDNSAILGENGSHCCDLLVIHRFVSGEIEADDDAHPIALTEAENGLHLTRRWCVRFGRRLWYSYFGDGGTYCHVVQTYVVRNGLYDLHVLIDLIYRQAH